MSRAIAMLLVAGCTLTRPAFASDEAYNFVLEYIRELGAMERIRAEAAQDLKAKDANALADCIRSSTSFQLELNTAIAVLTPMKLNAPVEDLIPQVIEFYKLKVALFRRQSDMCSEFMAGPRPNLDYGKLAADMPKITAHLERIDHALFQATPLVFASLIDQRPDLQNHLSHLVITKAQRDALVRGLRVPIGNKSDHTTQNFTVSSAMVLRDLLTKKHYKFADDPW